MRVRHKISFASMIVAAGLAGCAGGGRLEQLDEQSGATIVRGPAVLVYARTEPRYSRSARDYVYLGPVETNRQGVREYFLWVGVATTIDRGFIAPERAGATYALRRSAGRADRAAAQGLARTRADRDQETDVLDDRAGPGGARCARHAAAARADRRCFAGFGQLCDRRKQRPYARSSVGAAPGTSTSSWQRSATGRVSGGDHEETPHFQSRRPTVHGSQIWVEDVMGSSHLVKWRWSGTPILDHAAARKRQMCLPRTIGKLSGASMSNRERTCRGTFQTPVAFGFLLLIAMVTAGCSGESRVQSGAAQQPQQRPQAQRQFSVPMREACARRF